MSTPIALNSSRRWLRCSGLTFTSWASSWSIVGCDELAPAPPATASVVTRATAAATSARTEVLGSRYVIANRPLNGGSLQLRGRARREAHGRATEAQNAPPERSD